MKKLLSFILSGLFLSSAISLADEIPATDEWSDIGKMQGAWDGQEIITDDQFDKIIEQRTKRTKEKEQKMFKKKVGEALVPMGESQNNMQTLKEIAEDYPTLMVPKTLSINDLIIPPGFYRILAAKNKDNEYFINFYQGNSLIGKLPAVETENDYNAETINYAKIIYAKDESSAKVVYGCLEYNLIAETGTR